MWKRKLPRHEGDQPVHPICGKRVLGVFHRSGAIHRLFVSKTAALAAPGAAISGRAISRYPPASRIRAVCVAVPMSRALMQPIAFALHLDDLSVCEEAIE